MFLGIDIGTQSLKAVIIDAGLVVRGEGTVPYQPSFPRPGWAEQDPRLWLDALKPAIGRALAVAGIAAAGIEAIGVAGQLDGCVPCDANGSALGPAIIWMDRRASLQGIDAALIRQRTGLVADATHMAAKIKWFGNTAAVFHQPVSFMVETLTGARVMDHALASTTMLYDLGARGWSDELLDAFGVDRHALPAIGNATDIAGTLTSAGAEFTGLRAGTPVVVGTGDDFSNLIGCGITAPGTVGITLGTAESVGMVVSDIVIDPAALVETRAFPGGAYHLGNPGWLSGGAVRWFCSTFNIASDAAFSALAAEAPPGCDGLTFLPALSGAMAPVWNAGARGAFYGITAAHTTAHFARAVLEGTAFAMADVINRLAALTDVGAVRMMGGGAMSAVWTQIRADLLGRPIEVLMGSDASAMGAAILATGKISPPPLSLRRVEPNPATQQALNEAYVRYRQLFAALEPMFTARPVRDDS